MRAKTEATQAVNLEIRANISAVAPWREAVRQGDRDRYLTAMFAPEPARADLFVLYAFNLEVAKIRESVSEGMIGAIKLQWWRDVIAQIYASGRFPLGNPMVEALAGLVGRRGLSGAHFDALLDARARDMEEEIGRAHV